MMKREHGWRRWICLAALLCLAGCGAASGEVQPESASDEAQTDALTLEAQTAEGADEKEGSQEAESASSLVAGADEMAAPVEIVDESMVPVGADELVEGMYEIQVDSSSTMFKITSCSLSVENGQMTAVMTMGGKGYRYLYMGTGEEAAGASEDSYIPYVENEAGEHTFAVPVEALDAPVDCAAFSDNKEKWYERILVFRADSLPLSAFAKQRGITVEELALEDGVYQVDVTLEGGSGKAGVESPALLTVEDGKAFARIVWSSKNYDYMLVDGVRYDNEETEGNSTFVIPVAGFDCKLPVVGDTTAMSTPYEIDYTLFFQSDSIREAE